MPEYQPRTFDAGRHRDPRLRLAVFVDGCFWHGCPQHLHFPRANAARWVRKIETNRARDRDVTAQLGSLGWTVMRFWEHEDPAAAAAQVRTWVTARRG